MQQDDLHFGFFDSDIDTLLSRLSSFAEHRDVVITCIDSGTATRAIVEHELPNIEQCALGHFAVLLGEDVIQHRKRLFTGFDEIFVFRRYEWQRVRSDLFDQHFTSDTTELVSAVPESLRSMFVASGALAYASDGCGLNALTADRCALDRIRAVFSAPAGMRPPT